MGNRNDSCSSNNVVVNSTDSYELLSQCWPEKLIADSLRTGLPMIILPISLVNNFLSFLTLRGREMGGTSTTFFMLLLSVLDPLVLITKNFIYFPTLIVANAISCKLLYFFVYVIGYTNVWILVIMTGDKFLAVWFPLKVNYFCTINRAKMIFIVLIFITSFLSSHHFWTIDSFAYPQQPNRYYCNYVPERYLTFQRMWRYIDFVIWCFFPFVFISTLSVLIIVKLNHQRRYPMLFLNNSILESRRKNLCLNGNGMTRFEKRQSQLLMRTSQTSQAIRSRHRHITLMLLAVALVFLLLTLPNSIYFVLDQTYGFSERPKSNDYIDWLRYRRLAIVTVIMFQLSDLQHATNFFIYLLASNKFRRSVLNNVFCFLQRSPSTLSSPDQSREARRSTLTLRELYSKSVSTPL